MRSISINSISVGETAVATTYTHYAHLTRVMPAEIQQASQPSVLFQRKTAEVIILLVHHRHVGSHIKENENPVPEMQIKKNEMKNSGTNTGARCQGRHDTGLAVKHWKAAQMLC